MAAGLPVSSALLICDRIITEQGTYKKTLVGVFTQVKARSFPTRHYNMALYFRGILETGAHEFRINYSQRGASDALAHVEGVLNVNDPENPTELAVNLPFLDVPAAGEYEFRLWIDGAYVQRVSLFASVLELPEEGGDAED